MVAAKLDARGVGLGVASYVIWGLFPAFWPLLDPAAPVGVLAHRIAWTLLLMAVVVALLGNWSELRTLTRRGLLMIAAAAVLIALNWGAFIYAVSLRHVVEVALAYYITPLISVVLAVTVLHEQLRRAQWVALAVATTAIVVLTVENGRLPWIGLILAGSFGTYGLLRKQISLSASASFTAEALVLGPLAIAYLVWLEAAGNGTLGDYGAGHVLLLLAAGPVTAVPLLLFGAAARRIPLSTIGLLLYLTPTLQFLWGVLVLHEPMPPARWIGFGLVWLALAIFTADLLQHTRHRAPDGSVTPVEPG
ncbi:MAG: EamA family transporter RarD [Pseudonocardiales bacterium]|nr:EamA family transporter RarD [Pseudonocardiales bacterium]